MFGAIPSELCNLDLFFKIPPETGIQNLTLRGLQAIDDTGKRSYIVRVRKVDELIVNKVSVRDAVAVVRIDAQHRAFVVCRENPILSIMGTIFLECHVDAPAVFLLGSPPKGTMVLYKGKEVLLRLC
jgi:hypothetical protein